MYSKKQVIEMMKQITTGMNQSEAFFKQISFGINAMSDDQFGTTDYLDPSVLNRVSNDADANAERIIRIAKEEMFENMRSVLAELIKHHGAKAFLEGVEWHREELRESAHRATDQLKGCREALEELDKARVTMESEINDLNDYLRELGIDDIVDDNDFDEIEEQLSNLKIG
jgi:hypothetical protein